MDRFASLARRAVLTLCALGACQPAREVSTWPLALRQVGSCEVGAPSRIELVALGDFPSRSYELLGGGSELSAEELPLQLREILVRATTPLGVAQGRRLHSELQPEALWVLHAGRSCPLADTALSANRGRAVAVLPEGGALLVGGADGETSASAQALLLVEGQEFAVDVEGGMLLRRAFASATAVADRVLVAGGTSDLRAGAHDNYELFDRAAARFIAAYSGKLIQPRMQHSAVLLPDAKVLLVGGRAEPEGDPLASLEVVDPLARTTELLPGALQDPRVAPDVVVLDSGSVWVLGGRDRAGQLVGSVEVFDAQTAGFARGVASLPVRAEASVAGLPGARVAWLSCDHAPAGGGARCELALIRQLADELRITPVVLPFAEQVPNGLTDLRLIYAGDGQLLWTGADDSDPTGRRRAFLIDPVTEQLTRVDASRVPARLLRLQNGLIAELDDAGASLRAAFTRGRYGSADADLLADAAAYLALDAPGHWRWQQAGLQASVRGARVDLGELRFAAFEANLQVRGDYTLVLYDDRGRNTSLSVTAATVASGGCSYRLLGDERLQLVRNGAGLVVSGSACMFDVSDEALGMALVLEQDSVVRAVTVQRR